jgi:predicted amidophosphoribosyltransferase
MSLSLEKLRLNFLTPFASRVAPRITTQFAPPFAPRFAAQFAPPCQNCISPSWRLLCRSCLEELRFRNACHVCGRFPIASRLTECLPCAHQKKTWNKIYVSFFYRDGIQKFLRDIKDRHRPERFKEIELEHLPTLTRGYDFLIPVSSDPVQNTKRLFDPAEALASRLSQLWRIPVLRPVFVRRPFLKHQRELGREARKRYLRSMVALGPQILERQLGHILLVDDIATTGATLEVHSKLLNPITSSIDFFCLARALK